MAIKEDFREEGFEALIDHLVLQYWHLPMCLGRNSFMIAVLCGNIYFVNRIAELFPELLNKRDDQRNNVLHMMFVMNPSNEFIKEISKLKLIGAPINRAGKMPIEMLKGRAYSSMNNELINIYNNIIYNIEE